MSDANCNKNIEFKYCLNDENKVTAIEIIVTNPNLPDGPKTKTITINKIPDDFLNYELDDDQLKEVYEFFTATSLPAADNATAEVTQDEEDVAHAAAANAANAAVTPEVTASEAEEKATPEAKAAEAEAAAQIQSDISGKIEFHNRGDNQLGGNRHNSSLRKSGRRKRRYSKTMSKRDYIII